MTATGDDEDATVFSVDVPARGVRFAARADQPLLRSAEQAGVDLDSSCRNGTCRTCIVRLQRGAVHYRIAWPGVSADEKREGWILPCVAFPRSDLVL